jgi:hypothetical protein
LTGLPSTVTPLPLHVAKPESDPQENIEAFSKIEIWFKFKEASER